MLSKITKRLITTSQLTPKTYFHFSERDSKSPIIFGNNKSIFSLSHWWNGQPPRPYDYFVQDTLQTQIAKDWTLQDGIFRVLFIANLNDASMNININHLKKSQTLNQLIQLEASQKQKLVENPSTVIIKAKFQEQIQERQDQIARNIVQLDKLFQQGVGLKTSYLIDSGSIANKKYISQLTKKNKAICADVVDTGVKFQQVIFNHGYKLQHIFLCGAQNLGQSQTFRYNYDLRAVLAVLPLIDFKGKIVLPGGAQFPSAYEQFTIAAKQTGFTQKLQFDLQTDGWYTML